MTGCSSCREQWMGWGAGGLRRGAPPGSPWCPHHTAAEPTGPACSQNGSASARLNRMEFWEGLGRSRCVFSVSSLLVALFSNRKPERGVEPQGLPLWCCLVWELFIFF